MPLAEFSIDANAAAGKILVEVDAPPRSGMQPAARPGEEQIQRASGTLQDALAMLKPLTRALGVAVAEIGPDEVGIELGVKITGEGNLVVVKGTAEANLTVKVTWRR
jgi:hypothetical protein